MNKIIIYAGALGLILGGIAVGLYEIFAPYIIRFFIADAETVILGTDFLRIRSAATLFMFMSFFHVYLFNSFGEGKRALFLGVTRWLVFNIPMLFLLNALFGMYGIPWAQLAADVLVVTESVITYRIFYNRHIATKLKEQQMPD